MKRICKKILVFLFFFFFLFLFFRPVLSYADFNYGETARVYIDEYLLYMQAYQNALLSQYYTYSCVGVKTGSYERFYNLVITDVSQWHDGYRYTIGSGSYYVEDNIYHTVSSSYLYYYRDYITLDIRYYFPPTSETRQVTYCDLTNTFYSDPYNSSSLQTVSLNIAPPVSIGSISSRSGNFGDNILSARDTAYTPVVTSVTLPPFIPPVTVPPSTSPPDILTVLPPGTDENGTYIIDYSPYISADFYEPPATADMNNNNYIVPTANILSGAWDFLKNTDTDFFALLISLMLLSFAISMLI